jgi:hypothetical protein
MSLSLNAAALIASLYLGDRLNSFELYRLFCPWRQLGSCPFSLPKLPGSQFRRGNIDNELRELGRIARPLFAFRWFRHCLCSHQGLPKLLPQNKQQAQQGKNGYADFPLAVTAND